MSTVAAPGPTNRRLNPELEQLFREHSQMLYRTAYTMLGNAADAEDVLQTVFLRLLRHEPDFDRNPKGYLYRVAINLSLNVIRSRKRLEFTKNDERLEIPSSSQRLNSSTEDLRERVTDAVSDLSPGDAEVVLLRYAHEYTDAEIAKLLGVSRGTIAMRLFRSRRRLKKLMKESLEKK